MIQKLLLKFVAFAAVLATVAAVGQTVPISRTVPLTFTGVVSNSVTDSVRIVQPDGSYANYTGPLPEYPYAQDAPVTISFNATLPTKAFYDAGVYQGQVAADGIYRISVASPFYTGGTSPGGIGNSTIADVSGPIGPANNFGQPTNTVMTIVYDYNSDSYSLEGGGSFVTGAQSGPGYLWNAAAGEYVLCNVSGGPGCQGSASADPVLMTLAASADGSTVSTGNVRINSTDPSSSTGFGLFNLSFLGNWNLPQSNSNPVDVPEPGMLLLFGAASAILLLRRRSKRTA
jgi:hypothetical protein